MLFFKYNNNFSLNKNYFSNFFNFHCKLLRLFNFLDYLLDLKWQIGVSCIWDISELSVRYIDEITELVSHDYRNGTRFFFSFCTLKSPRSELAHVKSMRNFTPEFDALPPHQRAWNCSILIITIWVQICIFLAIWGEKWH